MRETYFTIHTVNKEGFLKLTLGILKGGSYDYFELSLCLKQLSRRVLPKDGLLQLDIFLFVTSFHSPCPPQGFGKYRNTCE